MLDLLKWAKAAQSFEVEVAVAIIIVQLTQPFYNIKGLAKGEKQKESLNQNCNWQGSTMPRLTSELLFDFITFIRNLCYNFENYVGVSRRAAGQ